MIATTIISSMSVKPFWIVFILKSPADELSDTSYAVREFTYVQGA
jgi:hypothetical protein